MFHSKGDRNGASASIFFPRFNRTMSIVEVDGLPVVQRLNNKYSLFAYVIAGEEVVEQLQTGDIVSSISVQDGLWSLVQPDPEGRYEVIPAGLINTL